MDVEMAQTRRHEGPVTHRENRELIKDLETKLETDETTSNKV